MKQMKNLGIIALLAVGILTSCHPEDAYEVAPANNAGNPDASFAREASKPEDPNMASIQWTGGEVGIREMYFNGGLLTENGEIKPVELRSGAPAATDFYRPYLLEMMKIPYGTYTSTALRMWISPHPSAKYSLTLSGTFNLNRRSIPVKVLVDEVVLLRVESMEKMAISETNEYLANVLFDINVLMRNLDQKMLQSLAVKEGVITISSTSNPEAYHRILANVPYMLRLRQTR